ncbi:zinc finger (C3HC4-type RING finger) family protein [Abeliophyllum distichum]|uniref:Zinc finger (C3HC4-type RING finger) family protein n=1 Tax=Abeliophyllum distichum TaxID=126358 RepID=A0ABD1Q4L6_9LAMI
MAEDKGEPFRVYCKGLVSKERVSDRIVEVAGIGVVICDSKDHVVFEMKKPLRNEKIMYVEIVELEALTEAMNAALTLNIKRVVFIFDDSKFHHPGVQNLRDKFPHYSLSSVAEGDIKHAYRLARDAVISQISWPIETSHGTIWKETCAVCLEDVDVPKMFSVDYCLHRCCFSCVKKHVEVPYLSLFREFRLWRQCKKCSHMIELAAGCSHMTCRCGYEFCCTCGSGWRNKKETCTCPRWKESYIIHN